MLRVYRKLTWDEWYLYAENYFIEHKDLLVPSNYITEDGYRLGRWIERQRARFNGLLSNPIHLDEKIALENIGMVWKLESRLEWENWIAMAEEYYRLYGNLEVHTDYMADGYRLGYWLREQRKKRKSGKLTQKQIRDLERYGMIWSCYERRDWNEWFTLAEKYFQENGNLLIPLNYKTEDGKRLGLWIFVQRERYSGKGGRKPLNTDQIQALERLSMVWRLDHIRAEKWEAMYQWVADYKSENNRLPLGKELRAPDGRSMGNWISVQRTALRKGKISGDKAKRLEELQILPYHAGLG